MLNKLILYLSGLNLIDGILTYYGLSNSFIEEGYPIGLFVQHRPISFLRVKIVFSLILFTAV